MITMESKDRAEEEKKETTGKKKPLYIWSIVVLVLSIAANVLYGVILEDRQQALIPFWIILSIASVFLPAVAKRIRIARDQVGKTYEVLAVIAGGFAFYSVIFLRAEIPLNFGYLGFLIGGLVYKFAGKEKKEEETDRAE